MKELMIMFETGNKIALKCDKAEEGQIRALEGFTPTFSYIKLDYTVEDVTVIQKTKGIIGYRLIYEEEKNGLKFLSGSSNTVLIGKAETISPLCIKAPDGAVSLSFSSDKPFDLFRLFDDNDNCIAETEDCILIGNFEGKTCYVCGYSLVDKSYVFGGVSEKFVCTPKELSDFDFEDIELTVVIPVFNVYSFLPRTVQAVLSSRIKNFEVILVDDGSEENTARLCDEYSELYKNVRVFHQENSGVCVSRNKGITSGRGSWVCLVDNDDVVHPLMYKKLLYAAKKFNCDIAIAQTLLKEEYNAVKTVLPGKWDDNDKYVFKYSFFDVMNTRGFPDGIYFEAVWNKIYRMDIARKTHFMEESPCYEDSAYSPSLYSWAERFVYVKDAFYIWDCRKRLTLGTTTTQMDKARSLEQIWAMLIISIFAPFTMGNPESMHVDFFKHEALFTMLDRYKKYKYMPTVKNVFSACAKYYFHKYDFDFIITSLSNDKEQKSVELYEEYKEMMDLDIAPWDGFGETPADCMGGQVEKENCAVKDVVGDWD